MHAEYSCVLFFTFCCRGKEREICALSGGQRRTREGNVRGELGKSNAIEAAIDGWVTSGAGAFVSPV